MNSLPELKLDWATHDAAEYACRRWHYSHTMPAGKLVKIGVWEAGKFIGVVLFGLGANRHMAGGYQLTKQQCCELCRVALTVHAAPVSRIVAIALRLLKKVCPGLRLVVSYADTGRGHVGGIYQAGNWIYDGTSEQSQWLIFGKAIHKRTVTEQYGTNKAVKILAADPNARRAMSLKHRYVMPLDAEIRARILLLHKPYPKIITRTKEQDAGHPPALDGVTPIRALQSNAATAH